MNPPRISIPTSARHVSATKRLAPSVRVVDPSAGQPKESVAEKPKDSVHVVAQQDEVLRRIGEISNAIRQIDEQRSRDIGDLRSLSIQVGIAAAERILGRELDAGRHELEEIVHAAIEEHKPLSPLRVVIHPQDVEATRQRIPTADVVGDESVEKGDCQIEYDEFLLQRSWRDRLEQIKASLLKGDQHVRSE